MHNIFTLTCTAIGMQVRRLLSYSYELQFLSPYYEVHQECSHSLPSAASFKQYQSECISNDRWKLKEENLIKHLIVPSIFSE